MGRHRNGLEEGKENAPKGTCFHYGENDQWTRNCKAYVESRKKVERDVPSTLGIYIIKVNIVSLDNIWVYNTNCGSHMWIDMQGLRNNRKLTKGEFDLRVGNGARVAAVAMRT